MSSVKSIAISHITENKDKLIAQLNNASWVSSCLFAVFIFFSISVAQIMAAVMVITWIWQSVLSNEKPDLSPLALPIAAFVFASLISATFSLDPRESFIDSKDLCHFTIFFAAYSIFHARVERVTTLMRIIVISAGINATAGIVEASVGGLDLYNRISGFQNISLTYAGLLMLALVLTIALMLFNNKIRRDIWLLPLAVILITALILALTRNAWVGSIFGVATVLALWKPKTILAIPLIIIAVMAVSPPIVQDRATSVLDPQDYSNRERLLIWSSGLKIVADNKLFGVGQNTFPNVYGKYRSPDAMEKRPAHLHNNILQIAVERGLVGLAAWLAIWITAIWSIAKALRLNLNTVNRLPLRAGLGCIIAFQVAGMFEYNYGDSEVQMLMFVILAATMAASHNAIKNKPKIIDSSDNFKS